MRFQSEDEQLYTLNFAMLRVFWVHTFHWRASYLFAVDLVSLGGLTARHDGVVLYPDPHRIRLVQG